MPLLAIAAAIAICSAQVIATTATEGFATTEQTVYFLKGEPYCDENRYRIYMVGDTETLDVSGSAAYDNVSGSTFSIATSENNCISIAQSGTSTATIYCLNEGTATISYSVTSWAYIPYLSGYTIMYTTDTIINYGTHNVRVVDYIDNINFPSSSCTLEIGDTESMAVETTDDYYSITVSEAIEDFYTYTSSDTSVATVDSSGTVTAVDAGTATITCTTANGITASCEVTVKAPDPTSVVLSSSKATLKIGKTMQLSYTLAPTNAATTVTYTSSNTKVATVSSSGKVTAKKAGTATITAKTSNGKKATCTITVKKNPTSISLNKSKATILVGKTKTLKATIKPSGAVSDVSWKSSNTKVATVSSSGKVTAKKAGTATITATSYNGLKATCKVTVKKINATKIKLNKTKVTINKGKTCTLKCTLTPSNATSSVTWKSSNTKVATVSSSGKVTAKKAGTATITAKTSNGKKATCKVTVKAPITGVSLNLSSTTLNVGKTYTLKATIKPSDTTSSKKLTWSSSDPSVATVNSNGKVTCKAPGTTTITVKTSNGKTKSCKVTVKAPITSVTLSKTDVTLNKGDTLSLSATIAPSNTTDSTALTWASDDTSVVTVSGDGEVEAVGPGTATITVTTSNSKTATCVVTVPAVDATAIELDSSAMEIEYGSPQTISCALTPSYATSTITWSSSDTSIATVDEDGEVTVKKAGTVTITATTSNGLSASCEVTAIRHVKKIYFRDGLTGGSAISSITICENLTETIYAITDPYRDLLSEDVEITWTTSDLSVVTVDETASVYTKYGSLGATPVVLVPQSQGTATVTATTSNGLSASLEVKVRGPAATSLAFEEASIDLDPSSYSSAYTVTYFKDWLTCLVTPEDADDTLYWSSSDTSVVVVYNNDYDETATLSVQGPGTAVITVTSLWGDATASITVNVADY